MATNHPHGDPIVAATPEIAPPSSDHRSLNASSPAPQPRSIITFSPHRHVFVAITRSRLSEGCRSRNWFWAPPPSFLPCILPSFLGRPGTVPTPFEWNDLSSKSGFAIRLADGILEWNGMEWNGGFWECTVRCLYVCTWVFVLAVAAVPCTARVVHGSLACCRSSTPASLTLFAGVFDGFLVEGERERCQGDSGGYRGLLFLFLLKNPNK